MYRKGFYRWRSKIERRL